MKETVDFKFSLNEKVKTNFDKEGIVEMCAIDEGGNTYFVRTAENQTWYKEQHLSEIV